MKRTACLVGIWLGLAIAAAAQTGDGEESCPPERIKRSGAEKKETSVSLNIVAAESENDVQWTADADPGAWEETDVPWPVNEGGLVGIGKSHLMDTYLSPGSKLNYSGMNIRVLNERMKRVRLANHRVSRQQILSGDLAWTDNPAGTASEWAGFAEYTLGYHYHFPLLPGLQVLAGASAHGLLGFIYNTRNGNNPASAKADIDLNVSGMVLYNWRIGNYPLTVRYQLTLPFAGVLFSPHYGQSYYEIFDLGNHSGVVKFGSFHNKLAMKNYVTLDFPVGNLTVRAGYLHTFYRTDVNAIETQLISHSFLIGLVKEFVAFGGKRLKGRRVERSAYY